MALGRKILSTRLSVGVMVLAAMALVCMWSYFFSFKNKVLSFGAGIPVIAVAIWWSWSEILRLKGERFGKRVWLYAFVWCLITLIPSCLLLSNANDVSTFSNAMVGYAILGMVAIIAFIVLWGRWINHTASWLDRDEWLKGKSFICLMTSAFLFWNVILFMVICSLWYWMVFVFAVAILNDSLAYLVGKRYGRNRISFYSPSKTWEGFLFSFCLVYVGIILFWVFIPEGIRNVFAIKGQWAPMIILGVPMLILCNLGDLQFSMHKRIFGIKDYSRVLGQHGGFWDRFDSHTFAFVFWGLCALVWQAVA